jgi:hypothetical protein
MSFFHNLNKKLDGIAARPESAQLNERDMGKHNNATTGFAALAKKTGGGEKGARIAGAQLAKMRDKGQVEEMYGPYDDAKVDAINAANPPKVSGTGTKPAIPVKHHTYDRKAAASHISGKDSAAYDYRGEVEEGLGDMARAAGGAIVDRLTGKPTKAQYAARAARQADNVHGAEGKARRTDYLDQMDSRDKALGYDESVEKTAMTPKQKSFAALAPPDNKITFADKIAGAKKEVDEMLGDVAAEAMRSALGGGRKVMADEGNDFTGARLAAIKAGNPTFKVGGKTYRVSGDTSDERAMDEASQDNAFTAHKRPRIEQPAKGSVEHGHKHDIKHDTTDPKYSGRIVTRRVDPAGISVGADDGQSSSDEPRGRGRPKGPAKAPERVTGGATRHKGGRKMTKEGDIDIADQGEYDQEGDMAKDSIKTVVRHAQALEKILGDNDNLPEWVQSKLAKIESMMTAVDDYMQNQETDQDDEMAMGEEKTSTRDNRAERAGKRVAKDIEYDEKKKDGIHGSRRGSEDNKADKAGKKVTKDIEHDEKEDDEKEDKPKKSKSKFKFGGSVYENLDAQLETLINESMNVTVNMATSDDGQGDNTITVTASGEDAMTLAQLLKSAGLSQSSHSGCSVCGQSSCGCEQVDENAPDYPTSTEYTSTKQNMDPVSNDLNSDKSTGQTTIPVLASQLRRQVSMEESVKIERNLFDLYKNFTK